MPAEPKARLYLPELDAMRCVGFLFVFLGHSHLDADARLTFVAGGSLLGRLWFGAGAAAGTAGLQLFFVLSAYIITTLLLRERERPVRSTFAISIFAESSACGLCISSP